MWFLGVTLVVGLAPLGIRAVFLGTLFVALVASAGVAQGWIARAGAFVSLIVIALVAELFEQTLEPVIAHVGKGAVHEPATAEKGDDVTAKNAETAISPKAAEHLTEEHSVRARVGYDGGDFHVAHGNVYFASGGKLYVSGKR